MSDVEKYAKELIQTKNLIEEFFEKIRRSFGGSFTWGIEQVVDSYLSLFDRFCPYKVGDRVELIDDVDVDRSSGWFHCKHFLVEGAKATVKSRGYSCGNFVFDIMFDDESWVDREGNVRLVEEQNKHTFHFQESKLKLTNE